MATSMALPDLEGGPTHPSNEADVGASLRFGVAPSLCRGQETPGRASADSNQLSSAATPHQLLRLADR